MKNSIFSDVTIDSSYKVYRSGNPPIPPIVLHPFSTDTNTISWIQQCADKIWIHKYTTDSHPYHRACGVSQDGAAYAYTHIHTQTHIHTRKHTRTNERAHTHTRTNERARCTSTHQTPHKHNCVCVFAIGDDTGAHLQVLATRIVVFMCVWW